MWTSFSSQEARDTGQAEAFINSGNQLFAFFFFPPKCSVLGGFLLGAHIVNFYHSLSHSLTRDQASPTWALGGSTMSERKKVLTTEVRPGVVWPLASSTGYTTSWKGHCLWGHSPAPALILTCLQNELELVTGFML